MKRTLISESLNRIGEVLNLNGWVENYRLMGKMVFIDLRDRSGKIQCIGFKADLNDEIWSKIKEVSIESVVSIVGKISLREESQINKETITGKFEIIIEDLKILNKSNPLPIPVIGDGYDINEESRLKYRYLDIRRERVRKILDTRSKFLYAIRESLISKDFIEVETPILTASTKEGARDFVVPSRVNQGKFYALPQSPQQYKQLLMTGGIENYFQIARCVRDEDLRADRGFEFSQIDIETSFREEEEVRALVEDTLKSAILKVGGKLRMKNANEPASFEVFTYDEVIEKFRGDKFDIRTEKEKEDGVLAFAWVVKYPMFKKVDKEDVAEVRDGKSGWTFTHNPFSGIKSEHKEWHLNNINIEKIEAKQYDLVCNGYEIGSGSIRNHEPQMLRATYKIMGYSDEEIESNIGHMLKAFELGTPPHGGVGLGVERIIMLLMREKSLKETIAFPMTYNGRTAVMDGPSELSNEQKKELGLFFKETSSPIDKVHSYLDSKNCKYKKLEHEPTPTCEDSAKVRGTKASEGAKALILRSKKNTDKNIMIVLPCNSKLNLKAVKAVLGSEAEFEKPEVIKGKYDLVIGGVPPLGQIWGIPTYYDNSLFKSDLICFNAGDQKNSVIMDVENFRKIAEITGDFSIVE